MDEREAILADLQGMRERAAALLRAKLDAVASQIKDAAARTVGELDVVLPPDLETLLPLGSVSEKLAAFEQPVQVTGAIALESLRQLDAGRQQSAVLQELLTQLEPWCGPRAILVFRDGQASGWAGAGFGAEDPSKGWRAVVAASPALARVAEGHPVRLPGAADPVISGWFGSGAAQVLIVPMSLRGKVVGGLLAAEGASGLAGETVQLLVYLTGLLMETLAVRTQLPTPAIEEPQTLEAALVEPEEPESPFGAVAAPAEPQMVVEPPPVAASAMVETPAPPVAPPTVTPPIIAPPVADASTTTPLPAAVPPAVPVPPAVAPEADRRHEEAKRFARLLVSEIRLYNEQAVVEGKANHDIYQRLREDIDRSREMYEQRIPAEVRAESNYFFEELVRILADGDADALGL